ncbi:MAG: EAL domain-containing protein [Chromatiales bacterium]
MSLLILLIDAVFISINYWADYNDLNRALLQKGQDDETSFHLALKSESEHMRLMASYFANTPEVQNLFLQGRRAVAAEGGGTGGQRAAQIRQQLYDLVSIGWKQITEDFNVRQLHFHLAPGDTSFLRVHQPDRFGDDLTSIRHSIVYSNTHMKPTQGFESGRARSGIRGIVPVFAIDPQTGTKQHVGALEAGNSFHRMLDRLSGETLTNYAVLLNTDFVKRTHWPATAEKILRKSPPIGQWFIESSDKEKHLRSLLANQRVLGALTQRKPVLLEDVETPVTVYSFPIRDFLGEQDAGRDAVGAIVSWSDASQAVAGISGNLSTNLIYGLGGFLLIEVLLYFTWGLAQNKLQQVIDEKTRLMNRINQDLRQEISLRSQSEKTLAQFKNSLEQQVVERTNELASTVETLKREVFLRRSTEKQLASQRENFRTTLQSIADGVIAVDRDCKITYMNPAATLLTGWSLDESLQQDINKIFNLSDANLAERKIYEDCLTGRLDHAVTEHHSLFLKNGSSISIEHSVSPIQDHDSSIRGLVIVFRDVSKTEEMTKELNYQATHDRLTGLFNRNYFEKALKQALLDAHNNNKVHAFLYMDLDQFKLVNDTSGHMAGDELLQQLGTVLSKHVRNNDVLARLGGDEFGLLLKSTTQKQAQTTAEHILQLVRDFRFVWSEKSFSVGVSIGISVIDQTTPSIEQLMSEADTACYVAKDKGRNRFYVLNPDDTELMIRKDEMLWVSRLELAIQENRFVLYAQPVVPANTSKTGIHYEILVRMISEEGELIPPGVFIPAAERYAIMDRIDFWIISQAFREVAHYTDIGLLDEGAVFNINLSGSTLDKSDLHDFIVSEFSFHAIRPEQICFEITETAAIANMTQAFKLIQSLRQLGVKFALDDFGSGLSSFAYLKMLPVNYLKIDGSFVKNLADSKTDRAMVQAINTVGHSMQLETIAEYAESHEIVELLKTLGIDFIQGYAIGKPRPLAEYLGACQTDGPGRQSHAGVASTRANTLAAR